MIKKCNCVHPVQDKLHGPFMRVMTPGVNKARCTACGTTHNTGGDDKKKKGK